jgi:type IV pilus biogenesis protein CpaD/CtpE
MKKLAIVAFALLAGCAARDTRTGGARLTQLDEQTRIVAEREKQCIAGTLARSRDQMARIAATPDASVESRIQSETHNRDRELSDCRSSADQKNAEISAHERSEYELQAQQEHDRAALMTILMTSRPR